jgi:hypothetical protein
MTSVTVGVWSVAPVDGAPPRTAPSVVSKGNAWSTSTTGSTGFL